MSRLLPDPADVARFADLALGCVHRKEPHQAGERSPVFFGCYDWHSAVHAHWSLARLARLFPRAPFASRARSVLGSSLTPPNVEAEVAWFADPARAGFEIPYGLGWLVTLARELRGWEEARGWSDALAPLETLARDRLHEWIAKLAAPVRTGAHEQTAFSLGLLVDYARGVDDRPLLVRAVGRAKAFFGGDRDGPLGTEPGVHDFLSPCLAEADLVRRFLDPADFAAWLSAFLPDLRAEFLVPVSPPDRASYKLSHLDGLNLSRAWMLEGIAHALPPDDARIPRVLDVASRHRAAGLAAVSDEHYAGGHWLGTFATYLVTGGGLPGVD